MMNDGDVNKKPDAMRVKHYTVLKCRRCGMEKMKIRARQRGASLQGYGKCTRCYVWEFDEIKVLGTREMCRQCFRLLVVRWAVLGEWRKDHRCHECIFLDNKVLDISQDNSHTP